jgi:flagellin
MISETLRAQIRGNQKALDNIQDGLNVLNIADGAMQTIEDNLQRIRELTVQAGNDTNAAPQRSAISNEINVLLSDIDRIATATVFNGVALLGTAFGGTFNIQVGPNSSSSTDVLDLGTGLGSATSGSLNLAAATIGSNASALTYLGTVDAALSALNGKRASLGALSNRLESSSQAVSVSVENLSASESRIRNVDVAAESANLTRNQILQQAAATVLSQANQTPQLALQLLKG